MVIWLYGYMVIWLYGYMVIWLYGYMVIWLYGYMVIWLYGDSDGLADSNAVSSGRTASWIRLRLAYGAPAEDRVGVGGWQTQSSSSALQLGYALS